MKKISKNDSKRLLATVDTLRSSFGEVEEAYAVMKAAIEGYNSTVVSFNEAIDDAKGFTDDIAREIDEYVDARSDKWKEDSDGPAPAYEDWKQAWEGWGSEQLSEVDLPEEPDNSVIGELEELPQEPSI